MKKRLLLAAALGLATVHGEISASLDSSLQEFRFASGQPAKSAYAPIAGVLKRAETELRQGDTAFDARNLEVGDIVSPGVPDYYLGDTLRVPAGVDWAKTYEHYLKQPNKGDFLFDAKTSSHAVYAAVGGNELTFTWVLTNGVTQTSKFSVAQQPSGRPRCIYWTNAKYQGTPIDLNGRFVSFFGDPNLLDVKKDNNGNVVRGLYLDETSHLLYAVNDDTSPTPLTGHVLMVYYDTGTHDHILHVQVVKVCAPLTVTITATVGSQLKPSGNGYRTEGLVPEPLSDAISDPKDGKGGPYLYLHKGEHSWSPKNNAVFALRPTSQSSTSHSLASVWWKEPDEMNVLWPFQRCAYDVTWPKAPCLFVRSSVAADDSASAFVASGLTAAIQGWIEPENLSPTLANGVFRTSREGKALLKLTGNDNVWFVPVESVYSDNVAYFTNRVLSCDVGSEIRPSAEAVVRDYASYGIDETLPGYVFPSRSANVWAPPYYAAWSSFDVPQTEDGAKSAIFPVTANGKDVEVWWMRSVRFDDLSGAAMILPGLVQKYRPKWPDACNLPSIVFASQQGSANDNIWNQTGALALDTDRSYLQLPPRSYFSAGQGTVLFWLRNTGKADAARILTLSGLTVDATRDKLTVRSGGESKEYALSGGRTFADWRHVGISLNTDGQFTVCLDGVAQTETLKADASVTKTSDDARIGASALGNLTAPGWEIGEVKVFAGYGTPAEIADERHRLSSPRADGLTAYWSFREGDLGLSSNGVTRVAVERRFDVACLATGCSQRLPGPPALGNVIFPSDSSPQVYVQNDQKKPGFNPNEEHALVMAGSGGYVAWAARTDLNGAGLSQPIVLVRYLEGTEQRMQALNVKLTDELYPQLAGTALFGSPFPGPHPFDFFADPWNKETTWTSLTSADDGYPCVFRDRKNVLWPRAAGKVRMHMHYPLQDGFYMPDGSAQVGTVVPWADNVWDWTVSWPTNGYKTMKIGCTLTKAMDGLPEVWGASSMAVIYPVGTGANAKRPVTLWDPTVRRVVASGLSDTWYEKYTLSYGDPGDVTMREGRQCVNGVPPSLADRIYVEPSTHKMYLEGKMNSDGVLYPNLVTAADRESLKKIKKDNDAWTKLVSSFPSAPVEPNKTTAQGEKGKELVTTTYSAVDHYALTTLGDTGWVVLVENDGPTNMVSEGSAISLQLVRVIPEYYCAKVIPVQDPNDKLSQKLTLMYTESFAGHADDFTFDWASALPLASGRIPDPKTDFAAYRRDQGLVQFTIGEQGSTLADLVDKYFTVRFQARSGSAAHATMGDRWSDWVSDPALAEGWLKRCLNNVTPFTQRMDDLEKNKAETAVSMIRQAGAPYEGDVALNQANLTSVGLIQLYTTLLNKAEKLSLGMKVDSAAANGQLLLAAERLGELYGVLGDEAYADALNSTIGFGSNFGEIESGLAIDYGAASSKLFCFDNQVASLLDEELALLRGRSGTDAPSTRLSPCFNRLTWNFTRGMCAGEVAYAVNYDITGLKSTTLGYEQAREMYPQGHGDAYGHYLSALKGWYRLLRNPYFSWPTPAKDAMNVGTTVVNVRYENEAKFATAAANVAKTAARVVDLTARAAWRDNGVAGSGLVGAAVTNAFGYGEWAVRGGYGALVNWVVGNSLLPADRTANPNLAYESEYVDYGLERIDRGTTDELEDLCTAAKSIQRTLDRMDAGFNPLGLSTNTVPFDLSPIGASDGTKTHYEQIADRAQVALDNAQKVLDKAQESANRLRLIAEAESGNDEAMESLENDYDADLIAIFGRPYDDDIGPNGTYKQGYAGPDLYHYAWMDLAPYGLSADDTQTVATYEATVVDKNSADGAQIRYFYDDVLSKKGTVTYSFSRNGLVVKPDNITGTRKANGTIQLVYADYLAAYARLKHATTTYEKKRDQATKTFEDIARRGNDLSHDLKGADGLLSMFDCLSRIEKEVNRAAETKERAALIAGTVANVASRFTIAWSDAGTDWYGLGMGAAIVAGGVDFVNMGTQIKYMSDLYAKQSRLVDCEVSLGKYEAEINARSTAYEMWELAVSTVADLNDALEALLNAATDAETAAQKISEQVEAGAQTLSGRTLARKRIVNNVAKLRYNDMFFRLSRNEALSRYEAAFDIAQRYTFLAAKAYGYDSGLLDAESGADFLRSIASERSLGGLQETKAKMDANWLALKGRLGLNNPQPYATWFSLRQELFRVLPTSEGDRAWRSALQQAYVDDLATVPEFGRLCQPVVATGASTARKEPGFVFAFPTCIDFAKNFFGKSLAEGDHAFDSTYFATKVAAAGVWLEGYSTRLLGANPVCYLVPAGEDRMRVPGAEGDAYASWSVLDQVVPLPYAIGTTELSDSTWYPSFDGQTAGADALARIRLYPSFRAYYGEKGGAPNDGALDSARLVGRSVWNTKWMLIIPAGPMLADREKACDRFLSTVSDIKLGLKTYSNSGN